MTAYHVTTPKKIERYKATGGILPPIRFFPAMFSAVRWAKRTNRTHIAIFEVKRSWPLPDHKPGRWTDEIVRDYRIVEIGKETT